MTTGLLGLEDRLHAVEHFLAQLGEFRPAVIDGRRVHRAQHAVGHVRRTGDLQEVTSGIARGILGHDWFLFRLNLGGFGRPPAGVEVERRSTVKARSGNRGRRFRPGFGRIWAALPRSMACRSSGLKSPDWRKPAATVADEPNG